MIRLQHALPNSVNNLAMLPFGGNICDSKIVDVGLEVGSGAPPRVMDGMSMHAMHTRLLLPLGSPFRQLGRQLPWPRPNPGRLLPEGRVATQSQGLGRRFLGLDDVMCPGGLRASRAETLLMTIDDSSTQMSDERTWLSVSTKFTSLHPLAHAMAMKMLMAFMSWLKPLWLL